MVNDRPLNAFNKISLLPDQVSPDPSLQFDNKAFKVVVSTDRLFDTLNYLVDRQVFRPTKSRVTVSGYCIFYHAGALVNNFAELGTSGIF